MRGIAEESKKYGSRLKETKCEHIRLNQKKRIRLRDGKPIPTMVEAKYLGCLINDKGDPKREVNKGISECYVCWKRLETFWKHSE